MSESDKILLTLTPTAGVYDYVDSNGRVLRNAETRVAYVRSAADLSKFEEEVPGFIVFQYGMEHMWQLKLGKQWKAVF